MGTYRPQGRENPRHLSAARHVLAPDAKRCRLSHGPRAAWRLASTCVCNGGWAAAASACRARGVSVCATLPR